MAADKESKIKTIDHSKYKANQKNLSIVLGIIAITAILLLIIFSNTGQDMTAKFYAPAQVPESCGNSVCETQFSETQINCCTDCTCRNINDVCVDNVCVRQ